MVPLREFRCAPSIGGDVAQPAVPDVHHVIIRATREAISVRPPSQTAYISRVALQDTDFVFGHAHVVVPDAPILTAATQEMVVPTERRDARVASAHRPQAPVRLNIPYLYTSVAEPNRNKRAVARPIEGADIAPFRRLGEVRHRSRLRVPDVRVLRERDGENVSRGPGEQIEVVVVDHRGRVEDAFWLRGEAPLLGTTMAQPPTR